MVANVSTARQETERLFSVSPSGFTKMSGRRFVQVRWYSILLSQKVLNMQYYTAPSLLGRILGAVTHTTVYTYVCHYSE